MLLSVFCSHGVFLLLRSILFSVFWCSSVAAFSVALSVLFTRCPSVAAFHVALSVLFIRCPPVALSVLFIRCPSVIVFQHNHSPSLLCYDCGFLIQCSTYWSSTDFISYEIIFNMSRSSS